MHFTREPLVETIIAPKEGFKLLVKSSKNVSSEEFFVDSIQVVMIGSHCFYRCIEKPKPFLLPASDYEVVEVRETKLSIKLPGKEVPGIKIAGGRETSLKSSAAKEEEREEVEIEAVIHEEEKGALPEEPVPSEKRGRRRHFRNKRMKEEERQQSSQATQPSEGEKGAPREEKPPQLIPPPPTLISETISRYKDLPDFAGAFFEKEKEKEEVEESKPQPSQEPSESDEKPLREELEEPDFLNP